MKLLCAYGYITVGVRGYAVMAHRRFGPSLDLASGTSIEEMLHVGPSATEELEIDAQRATPHQRGGLPLRDRARYT